MQALRDRLAILFDLRDTANEPRKREFYNNQIQSTLKQIREERMQNGTREEAQNA